MNDIFSVMSRTLTRECKRAKLSANEVFVLSALMSHGVRDDGTVGVSKGGYVMSSNDVAEYVGCITAADARRAVMGLVRKGILDKGEKVKRGNVTYSTHKLVVPWDTDKSPVADSQQTGAADSQHSSVANSQHSPVIVPIVDAPTNGTSDGQPSLSNNLNTSVGLKDVKFADFGESGQTDVASTANANSKSEATTHDGVREEATRVSREKENFRPKYPYPRSEDEVVGFFEDSDDDLIQWALSLDLLAYDFVRKNERCGWRMSGDDSPIYDWTKVFRQMCAGAWVRAVEEDDDVLSRDPDVAKARRRLLSSQKHKSGYLVDSREKARQNRRQALTAA